MKRIVTIPLKPVDGEVLETELVAAGIPVVPHSVEATPDVIRVMLNVAPDNDAYDAAAIAVLNAHVMPPGRTPSQVKRDRTKALLRAFPDLISVLVRAVVLELAEALRQDRQEFNRLRSDVVNGRAGANVTAQARPVPTMQQVIDAILSRVDSIVS